MDGKMKNLDGTFEAKNFSYTYSLFKKNYFVESKIIKYRKFYYINTGYSRQK